MSAEGVWQSSNLIESFLMTLQMAGTPEERHALQRRIVSWLPAYRRLRPLSRRHHPAPRRERHALGAAVWCARSPRPRQAARFCDGPRAVPQRLGGSVRVSSCVQAATIPTAGHWLDAYRSLPLHTRSAAPTPRTWHTTCFCNSSTSCLGRGHPQVARRPSAYASWSRASDGCRP
jgi:hypothetical protein